MPLPTLSYAQSSSLHGLPPAGPASLSAASSSSSSSAISLPAVWHSLVDHGSNKRKALTLLYDSHLHFLQQEIDRITAAFQLSDDTAAQQASLHAARSLC